MNFQIQWSKETLPVVSHIFGITDHIQILDIENALTVMPSDVLDCSFDR